MDAIQISEYLDLNKWCGSVLFKSEYDQTRIYLDLDRFQDEGEFLDASGNVTTFESKLRKVVSGIVIRKANAADRIFDEVNHQVGLWKVRNRSGSQISDPPPVIPVLLAFVLAAEKMGEDGRNSLDYYSQLLAVVSLPESLKADLGKEYRQNAVEYFQLLADWLNLFEGEYGIPSFPGPRSPDEHVEVAIRQALIRSADRKKLERLFQKANFMANQMMSGEEIEAYIEEWEVSYAPLSVYFWRHFRNAKTRDVICEAVALELANWDGTAEIKVQSDTENFSLLASTTLMRGIFGNEFALNLISDMPHSLIDCDWKLEGRHSEEVWFEGRSQGNVTLRTSDMALDKLLKTNLVISNTKNKHKVVRNPDSLLVLNKNSITGSFVEASCVSSGLESLLLCIDLNEMRLTELEDYLQSHARIGYQKLTKAQVPALPNGWVLFSKVEVILKSETTDFLKLFPQLALQSMKPVLKLEGGAGLRDNTNTYIEGYLPSIAAISSEFLVIKIRIIDSRTGELTHEITSMSGSISVDLNTIGNLGESIQIQLLLGGSNVPVRSTRLLIKSRAAIRKNRISKLIKHDMHKPNRLAAISGDQIENQNVEGISFRDLFSGDVCEAIAVVHPPSEAIASTNKVDKSAKVQATEDIARCWVRGSHHWHLQTTGEKRAWDEARCLECKKETKFRTTGVAAKVEASHSESRKSQESVHHRILIEHSPKVLPAQDFDLKSIQLVLSIVGVGTYSKLNNLLEQFAYSYDVRTIVGLLESMCIINTARDKYGRIEYWSVNPPLAQVDNPDKDQRLAFSRYLASIVPNFSQVASLIPKGALANSSVIERFDLGTLKFNKVSHVELPGAYRFITTTGNLYAFFGDAPNYQGNLQFGSAQLVKHLHALYYRKLLFSYDPQTEIALIPIGCELPGVYGKVLGIINETPPDKIKVGNMYYWEYRNIPQDVLFLLSSKLGN